MAGDPQQISPGDATYGEEKAVRFDTPLFADGWTAIPNSVLMDSNLSTAARLVYAGLLFYAREQDSCWPGQKKFADRLGTSDRTMRRALTELKDANLIEITRRGTRSNVYTLLTRAANVAGGNDENGDDRPDRPDRSANMAKHDRPIWPIEEEAVEQETEKKKEKKQLDDEVTQVWVHYVAVFEPGPGVKCGPNRVKGIKRALQEVDAETLMRAIEGLKNYRAHKPGDTSIETIWKTFKGTGTMVERINFFAMQSKGSAPGEKTFPSAQRAIVAQRQNDVQRGHDSSNEEIVERAKESEAWLLEHGIETVRREDGYPVFRAVSAGGPVS